MRQLLEQWLENVRPPKTKPKTWVGYEYQVRMHLQPALGHIRVAKLTAQNVRDFIAARLDLGLSTRTSKHLRDTLRAALNQAVEDGELYRNVAKLAKPPAVEARAL